MSNAHRPGAEPERPSTDASKVAELRGHEARLAALRERRADLEVERIVARSALRRVRVDPGPEAAGPKGAGPEVAGADAASVVDALDRLRRLESAHAAHRTFAEAGGRSHEELLERLRAGDHALEAWLAADRDNAGARGRRIAKQALLAVCLAMLALAFLVHLAFLVLLVPVGGAMSFLLWTGQDRAWRRIGARRRFERLGIQAPAAWTEEGVRERRHSLLSLAAQVRQRASAALDGSADAEPERLHAELDAARSDLRDALSAAGIDEDRLDASAEATLRAIARVHRAEHALDGVVEEMAGERDEAGAIREPLYRRIAQEGAAAPDGDASTDALEAGIERAFDR